MHGVSERAHYRVWAPPESRVRIEYSSQVAKQLSVDSARDYVGGILLGRPAILSKSKRRNRYDAVVPNPGATPGRRRPIALASNS